MRTSDKASLLLALILLIFIIGTSLAYTKTNEIQANQLITTPIP